VLLTPLTMKALQVMYKHHQSQVDANNLPYCFHPYDIANEMHSEDEVVCALLHEVIQQENFDVELLPQDWSSELRRALKTLKKEVDESYDTYIKRVADNDIARKVKISDLRHNCARKRLTLRQEDDEELQRYQFYYNYLLEADDAWLG